GRPEEVHADHLLDHVAGHACTGRDPVLQRLLFQGHHHRGGAPGERARRLDRNLRLLGRAAWRLRHLVLQLPPAVPDLPWQGALPPDGRVPRARGAWPPWTGDAPRALARRWAGPPWPCTPARTTR